MSNYPEDITDTTVELIVKHPNASRSQIQKFVEKKHPGRSSIDCVSYYSGKVKIILGMGRDDTKIAIIYREMEKNPNLLDDELIRHIQKVLPKKFGRTESDLKTKIDHLRHVKRSVESLGYGVNPKQIQESNRKRIVNSESEANYAKKPCNLYQAELRNGKVKNVKLNGRSVIDAELISAEYIYADECSDEKLDALMDSGYLIHCKLSGGKIRRGKLIEGKLTNAKLVSDGSTKIDMEEAIVIGADLIGVEIDYIELGKTSNVKF